MSDGGQETLPLSDCERTHSNPVIRIPFWAVGQKVFR